MITKTAERLVEIEHEIRTLRTDAINGKVQHGLAMRGIQELEEERERLWAKE